MAVLVIQFDVRLRELTPDGLSDLVGSFFHYDLPLDAAGHDWTSAERDVVHGRVMALVAATMPELVVGLLDHCRWEQPELPFQ